MTEPSAYDCIEAMMLPLLSDSIVIPDISGGFPRKIKYGAVSPVLHQLQPNDILEVLLVVPGIGDNALTTRSALLYSQVNPTVTTYTRLRYIEHTLTEGDSNDVPVYLHQAAGCVSTTEDLDVKCRHFMKSQSVEVTLIENVQNGHATIDKLPADHQFWMNGISPNMVKTTVHANNSHRPSQCLHILAQFTNNSGKVAHITISGKTIYEKTLSDAQVQPRIARQMPFGLTHYILAKLFNKYFRVVYNPANMLKRRALRQQLRNDTKNSIKQLVEEWKSMLSAIPQITSNDLINFIIFYLE